MSGGTRLFLKILTGIVYLPLAILLNYLWEKWESSTVVLRLPLTFLIVPLYIVVAPMTNWWAEL